MLELEVKSFGKGGLHITLPTSKFKIGEIVKIMKDKDWEIRVREIVREEMEEFKSY